jgi:hypothetical protein
MLKIHVNTHLVTACRPGYTSLSPLNPSATIFMPTARAYNESAFMVLIAAPLVHFPVLVLFSCTFVSNTFISMDCQLQPSGIA